MLDVDYVVGAYVGVLAETVVLPPSNVVTPLEHDGIIDDDRDSGGDEHERDLVGRQKQPSSKKRSPLTSAASWSTQPVRPVS